MPTKPTCSHHKIILLVVFICAAIMTSLFVFHMNHKSTPSTIASEDGMIFPIAREIKPFELQANADKKFTQQNLQQHWTLMLFGFTHCATICPTSMDMLNRVYLKLHSQYPNLQVVMISLDPERDTPAVIANYVHSFNTEFIGITGKTEELRKLQSQLGI